MARLGDNPAAIDFTSASSALVIANALRSYLETLFEHGNRLFVRLDGFDNPVYASFLAGLDEADSRLAGRSVVVRTTGLIAGREVFAIDKDKTATWHRNHVPSGHALLLIFNKATSDAQSLKDVFPITETRLTREGFRYLITAAFRGGYVLNHDEEELLTTFVQRFREGLAEPQLRSLTGFLMEVSRYLSSGESTNIKFAIAEALPELRTFRCRELAGHLNTPRGDRLLRDSYEAARIGEQLIEERKAAEYRTRLKSTEFKDDREIEGMNPEEKRVALEGFLLEEDSGEKALRIDWSEVASVLHKKAGESTKTKLEKLAQDINEMLAKSKERSSDLPDYGQEALAQLEAGSRPDADDLDRLSTELQDKLGKALTKRLRNLSGVKPTQTTTFLAELTNLSLEILGASQEETGDHVVLRVRLAPRQFENARKGEAAAAFRALYGGVEALIPAIEFDLSELWKAAENHLSGIRDEEENDESEVPETTESTYIHFHLSLARMPNSREDGGEELRADLTWECPSDGLALTTLENLKSLAAGEPLVPAYEDRRESEGFDYIDLGKPRRSFGRWYESPLDLKRELERTVLPRPGARQAAVSAVGKAIDELAQKAYEFASEALQKGLLASDVFGFLGTYDATLSVAARSFTNQQEAVFGFGVLDCAWTVRPHDSQDWALVTLLHPLKLLWWRNRAALFGEMLEARSQLAGASLVDDRRFGSELGRMYSSVGFPAVLSLLVRDGCEFYLPAEEREGYELFRSSEAETARNSGTTADEDTEAQEAAGQLAAVVEDYVKTYPFSKDGLDIYLVECRNGLLPGRLVEKLDKRSFGVRLSVVVHTPDRGAEVFRKVSNWLAQHESFQERPAESYFPRLTLKVLEGQTRDAVLGEAQDKDLVILADVLSVGGQRVTAEQGEPAADAPMEDFIPFPRSRPAPFGAGDLNRRLRLDVPNQPAVVRRFYNAQYASHFRQPASDTMAMPLALMSSLQGREDLLRRLHEHFNWVVCYDAVADRFLLRQTLPEKVQVIRYSLGLGAAGRKNLTVSSSTRTQEVVVRRLAGRLREMFSQFSQTQLGDLAHRLVEEANDLSGDIVLRAAGPGAYLNELIGLVATKRLTEERYWWEAPDALKAWIYLDDHHGWFSGKRPDLVFIAISEDAEGIIDVRIEVAEAKCVSAGSFEHEAADAERQVVEGLRRLALAWAPDREDEPRVLDAPYWRDQLVRAVAANLSIVGEQQSLWDAFQRGIDVGSYNFDVSGHAWAFCHDGRGTVPEGQYRLEEASNLPTSRELGYAVSRHLFTQDGLHSVLKEVREPKEGAGKSSEVSSVPRDGGAGYAGSGDWSPDTSGTPIEPSAEVQSERAAAPVEEVPGEDTSSSLAQELGTERIETPQALAPPATGQQEETDARKRSGVDPAWLAERARDLDRILNYYNIKAYDVDSVAADVGPSIVRFKIRLRAGERLARLQSVAEDVGRELALHSIPLINNVSGTTYVSIDLPRPSSETVSLLPLLTNLPDLRPGELPIVLGESPDGNVLIEDLSEFPHLLVGGATNSGKSVFLRSLLLCLMERHGPNEISLLIVDPKRTDFSFFDAVPSYLLGSKVITDGTEARDALLNLVHEEMPRRQRTMAGRSMRIKDFNRRYPEEALKPIVAVIDEYAQLISVMGKAEREAFERDLMSLAQVARSTGIHLVLATQRPSADIVTGTLKANLPAGIAFKVAGAVNSRIVIDQNGAENLLGRGDLLFKRPSGEILRLQAPFLSEEELAEHLSGFGQKTP